MTQADRTAINNVNDKFFKVFSVKKQTPDMNTTNDPSISQPQASYQYSTNNGAEDTQRFQQPEPDVEKTPYIGTVSGSGPGPNGYPTYENSDGIIIEFTPERRKKMVRNLYIILAALAIFYIIWIVIVAVMVSRAANTDTYTISSSYWGY